MKIRFNSMIPLAGIGLVPWTRLGPERWFPLYKIASWQGWDLPVLAGSPEIIATTTEPYGVPHLRRFASQNLVEADSFQAMLNHRLPGYNFLTYKPLHIPAIFSTVGSRFLSADQILSRNLENKAEFRTRFSDLGLPFPEYRILAKDEATLKVVLGSHDEVILQDEQLSGGRGTFRVSSEAELRYALTHMERLGGGKHLVSSKVISNAHERSVQAVITRHGVFVGPLQKQIVGHPLLANLDVADGDRFCGAEITAQDILQAAYIEIREYALRIGARMQQQGYRGIFGLDCLIDSSGRVYVLEVNPRITGVTPLLTMLYREEQDIPFYLLHILELGDFDYEILDETIDPTPAEGSLMILHSHETKQIQVVKAPKSGLYNRESLTFREPAFRLSGKGTEELLVQQYVAPAFHVRPGGRVLTAYTNRRILDDTDVLTSDICLAVERLASRIETKEVKHG